jgi:hypothetical protein
MTIAISSLLLAFFLIIIGVINKHKQMTTTATLATVMPAISAVDKPPVPEGGLLPLLVVGDGPFPGVGPLPGVVVTAIKLVFDMHGRLNDKS